MIGLIILGHGSNLPYYRKVLELHRKRIEEMGIFDEVRTAFVIEKPDVFEVIESMIAENIFIVPLFIAYGQHIEELVKSLEQRKFEGKKIYICKPIGEDWLVTYAILISFLKELRSLQKS